MHCLHWLLSRRAPARGQQRCGNPRRHHRVRGGAASQSDMLERLRSGEGFAAADQSGVDASALEAYGVPQSDYKDESEMLTRS